VSCKRPAISMKKNYIEFEPQVRCLPGCSWNPFSGASVLRGSRIQKLSGLSVAGRAATIHSVRE
jgi:hypothetical protein